MENDSKTVTRVCSARFEPDQDEYRTHTCDLPGGHENEKHHCPRCGVEWTTR